MRGALRLPAIAIGISLSTVGCGGLATATFEPGVERMPGPASVWLTSNPAAPARSVPITMRSPDDPDLLFAHTFRSGEPLRGIFATSEGRYRLAAFSGACSLDLALPPGAAVEVILTLDDVGCELTLTRTGDMNAAAMQHDEPAVLITNHGVGDATPFEEPRPGPS